MEKRNFFNHTAPAPAPYGKDVSERAKFFKYPMRAIGENIAYNYTQTPYSYFEQWRKSPGHCENMMFDKFKEIGYGVSGIYATLVLGVSSGSTQQTNSKPTSAESKSYIIPIVYGRHTCGNCSESMRRFREAGIEYVFYDVDADDSKNAEMWRLLGNAGSVTFPVIKVNDKTYPSALDKIDEIIRICKTPVVNNTEKKNNEEKAKGGGKVKVVLYGNSECLNTINCMQSLKSKNIEFTLLDVVKNDKYNDEMTEYVNRIGGGMMWYPVVVINDGEHIINQGNNHVDEIVNLVKGKLK
jgi:glutaredoxin